MQAMFLGQKDPGFACATWSDNFDVFWDTLVLQKGGPPLKGGA